MQGFYSSWCRVLQTSEVHEKENKFSQRITLKRRYISHKYESKTNFSEKQIKQKFHQNLNFNTNINNIKN